MLTSTIFIITNLFTHSPIQYHQISHIQTHAIQMRGGGVKRTNYLSVRASVSVPVV